MSATSRGQMTAFGVGSLFLWWVPGVELTSAAESVFADFFLWKLHCVGMVTAMGE